MFLRYFIGIICGSIVKCFVVWRYEYLREWGCWTYAQISIKLTFFRDISIEQFSVAGSILGVRCFTMLILFEFIMCPQNMFRGSLIPRPTFVVGRVATQSASRGGKIVRCMTDYGMAIKWIKTFPCRKISDLNSRMSFNRQKGEEKNSLPVIVSRGLRTGLFL